jgi:hypothetical protein
MRKGSEWHLLRDGQTVASGASSGGISQTVEWMIGRMRAFNGNYEGLIGEVIVLNHAVTDPLKIENSQLVPGGDCQLAWSSQPGFEYGIEWSSDLGIWNLLRIVPASPGTSTLESFPDPGDGRNLFIRIH